MNPNDVPKSSDWFTEDYEGRSRLSLKVVERLFEAESPYQRIEIFDTAEYGRVLALAGVYMTSERDEFLYHEMLAQPALCAAPRLRDVLVVGGGDGGTAREVLRHAEVERVTMVEIDEQVVRACQRHLPTVAGAAWDDPRLELVFEDGLSWLSERAEPESFDVILVDGADPVGPAAALFREQFFDSAKRALRPEGALAIQSESPFIYADQFYATVRTLRRVFGRAHPYFGHVPLYGGYWSWTWAGRAGDPRELVTARAAAIEAGSRYYNREIHRAAFALPNHVRRELEG